MALVLAGAMAMRLMRAGAASRTAISHDDCDAILANARPTAEELSVVRRALGSGQARTLLARCGMAPGDSMASASYEGQIEVLCARHGNARYRDNVRIRYCSMPLAANSLRKLPTELGMGDATYVVSAPLELVLSARRLEFGQIVGLAMELCGTYSSDGVTTECLYGLPCAVTLVELAQGLEDLRRAALDKAGTTRASTGLGRCLDALPYVLADSASPMETAIAAILGIPSRRGGWGIAGLSLNTRIDLDVEAARIARHSFIRLDGFVRRTNVGYEYDSKQFHGAEKRELSDRARLSAVQLGGLRLFPLTWDMVADERRFESFCAVFARAAGQRTTSVSRRTMGKRQWLRRSFGLPTSAPIGAAAV